MAIKNEIESGVDTVGLLKTALLDDEDKVNLGALDMFDRVINVKMTTEKGDTFVVRSDFETYYPNLMDSISSNTLSDATCNRYYIRKCQYKPNIKIQYKRVASDVGVSIDLYMSNFYLLSKDGKMLQSFSSIDMPLKRVEIELGYFGMFREYYANKLPSSVDELFDFDWDKMKTHGISYLTMESVEYTQTDKLPPDSLIHVHGFVTTYYTPQVESLEEGIPSNYNEIFDATDNYSKVVSYDSAYLAGEKGNTIIEKAFYKYVTRRYVNKKKKDAFKKYKGNRNDTFANETAGYRGNSDEAELSIAEANEYGVKVYLSTGALKFAKEFDKQCETKFVDSEGNVETEGVAFKIELAGTVWGQFTGIKASMNITDSLLGFVMADGDFMLYMPYEARDVKKAMEGTEAEGIYALDYIDTFWKNKLPAVYNITNDALCTITCPFFFILSPFQKFYFESRYALGGLVSYYANFLPTINEFYALWQTVSFATVEDVNECTIVCTGRKKE